MDAAVRRGVYRVFRIPRTHADKTNLLMADDLVGRQSVTVRDAMSLGLKGEDRYVVVEGTETALVRAAELLKGIALPLETPQAADIYRRFRAQDEEAASGMGLIFGP